MLGPYWHRSRQEGFYLLRNTSSGKGRSGEVFIESFFVFSALDGISLLSLADWLCYLIFFAWSFWPA